MSSNIMKFIRNMFRTPLFAVRCPPEKRISPNLYAPTDYKNGTNAHLEWLLMPIWVI